MTNSNQMTQMLSCDPEKLSGHDLVNYLIAHPEARGNFKWHSFRSCMWRDLLIAQPGFQDVADFQKIHHWDAFKILNVQPQLAHCFDWETLWIDWQEECVKLLIKHPHLANKKTTSFFAGYAWSKLLIKLPQLAHLCKFKKLYACDWVNLITAHISFAEQCPWADFYSGSWCNMMKNKNICLKYFKMNYIESFSSFKNILENCYFGDDRTPGKGVFARKILDAATFLIIKRMDKENSKRFLKYQFKKNNWEFVEKLCELSLEDAMDVYGKKYISYDITLSASDGVFEKLFPTFDLTSRDPGGNSYLLPALIHCLNQGDMSRYNFLLAKGLDPDEKNLAGFSCNDLLAHIEAEKAKKEAEEAKKEAERLKRNARAREKRAQDNLKKMQAKKGKK